jgi:hypothetical protein
MDRRTVLIGMTSSLCRAQRTVDATGAKGAAAWQGIELTS